MDATMEIFQLRRKWPKAEIFSLTDQILRSSRPVPANTAEAWRNRRYPAAWVSKLSDAEGEAAETQTHLDVALRCGYIREIDHEKLDALYEEVLSMLVNVIDHPDQWTIRSTKQ
jgi:four helix bundle protein